MKWIIIAKDAQQRRWKYTHSHTLKAFNQCMKSHYTVTVRSYHSVHIRWVMPMDLLIIFTMRCVTMPILTFPLLLKLEQTLRFVSSLSSRRASKSRTHEWNREHYFSIKTLWNVCSFYALRFEFRKWIMLTERSKNWKAKLKNTVVVSACIELVAAAILRWYAKILIWMIISNNKCAPIAVWCLVYTHVSYTAYWLDGLIGFV